MLDVFYILVFLINSFPNTPLISQYPTHFPFSIKGTLSYLIFLSHALLLQLVYNTTLYQASQGSMGPWLRQYSGHPPFKQTP